MTWLEHYQARRWLVLHFGQLLPPAKAKKMRRHVARCGKCRALHAALSLAEGEGARARDQRHARMEQAVLGALAGEPAPAATSSISLRAWLTAAACAALALIALHPLLSQEPVEHHGFREKSASAPSADAEVAIYVYRRTSAGALQRVDDRVFRGEGLAFAYTNQARARYDRLMVFGIGQDLSVYWFYPSWTDQQRDPKPEKISDGVGVELPDEIVHDYRGTSLRVFALFTARRDLSVKGVEQLVSRLGSRGVSVEHLERIPLEGTAQHSLLFEVVSR